MAGIRIVSGASDLPGLAVRQIASGCWFPESQTAGAAQWNTRTPHYARDTITSLQIAYANFYGNTETSGGAPMTIVETFVEYPAGTMTRLTYGGGNNGQTIAAGTVGALSDSLTINIPRNALFYIRSFITHPNGVPYISFGTNLPLGGAEYAASGVTSKAASGTIGANSAMVYPCLIVGPTRRPSVFVVGDSIAAGTGDDWDDLSLERGIVQRSIGSYYGCTMASLGSATMNGFNANSALRRGAMGTYFTHTIYQLGFNSIASSAATCLGYLNTFKALSGISSTKIWTCTLTPGANSTDAFATEANQTPYDNVARVAYNKALKAGIAGIEGCFDIGREVEGTVMYGGKFRVDLGTPTVDNVHPQQVVYLAVKRSRAINPALITL